MIFEYQKDTETESAHQPGLTIQKKEADEQISEIQPAEEENIVIKMEIIEEPSPSCSSHTLAVAENFENPKLETTTETIKVIDLTEKVDVAKNTDLFKAIFLDSESESEEEREQQEDQSKNETLKSNVLSDSLLPKIKAKKDGIFSNLDLSQLAPVPNKHDIEVVKPSAATVISENSNTLDDLSYGPRAPQMFISKTINTTFTVEESDDEWVEKGSENNTKKTNSHKHKKKKKKEKHEHKKKHKHNKKKK